MTYSIQLHSPHLHTPHALPAEQQRAENLQNRFGQQIATRLSEGASELPYDISERLRAARVQSLATRKLPAFVASAVVATGNTAAMTGGDESPSIWRRMASVLPLIALVGGLLAINMVQKEDRANELAEVDTALLTDDLPPSAYADPGFVQFLRAGSDRSTP
jgi:hypothetical protein